MGAPSDTSNRAPLSASAIGEAALALIDRDGLDALSMRRLGNALGYEAMALYKHVADKEAVLDAAVGLVYAEMTAPSSSASWDDRLRHSAHELRRVTLRHPQLFVRAITRPPATTPVLERIDAILSALRETDADDERVIELFWLFVNLTSGALLAESAALGGAGGRPLDGADPQAIAQCAALAQFGDDLASCDFETEFGRAVEAFVSIAQPD